MRVKNTIVSIFILFAALSASAQGNQATPQAAVTLSYRLDYIRPDSFYIVEIKETAGEPGKRGKVEEEAILFKDTMQVSAAMQQAEAQQAQYLKRAAEFAYMRESIVKLLAVIREKNVSQPSQGR